MNKQPYYHDIQIEFHGDYDIDAFDDFLFSVVNNQLTLYVNERLVHHGCESVEGSVEVVGGSDGLQVLFTSTNGYEPIGLHSDIEKFVAGKLDKHLTYKVTVDILSGEPEAGDPHDLM